MLRCIFFLIKNLIMKASITYIAWIIKGKLPDLIQRINHKLIATAIEFNLKTHNNQQTSL